MTAIDSLERKINTLEFIPKLRRT